METDTIWIASFDIGKKNFSFYIEEMDKKELGEIQNIKKCDRYEPCGIATPEFQKVLDKVCKSGHKILLENKDLTENTDKSKYLDDLVMYNLTKMLDKYSEYWEQCDIILIEKQMSFGKIRNTMAIRLEHHTWSYFSIKYGIEKKLVVFMAYHKTQVLGAEKLETKTKTGKIRYKAVKKPARKKWAIKEANRILTMREDDDTLGVIAISKKKDDLSDVIVQLQAYKYLEFVEQNFHN